MMHRVKYLNLDFEGAEFLIVMAICLVGVALTYACAYMYPTIQAKKAKQEKD